MDDDIHEPPHPRVFLIANGFTGIVAPGECGCRLDDLMPCSAPAYSLDRVTGLPQGCKGGYAHTDPRGGDDWIVSTKPEPPSAEAFDIWTHLF